MKEKQKQSAKTNVQPNAHVWIVSNKSGAFLEMVIFLSSIGLSFKYWFDF